MIKVNSVKLNNIQPNFKGARPNYGVPYIKEDNIVESGFIKGFLGILKTSKMMYSNEAQQRALKIKESMDKTRLDFIA